MYLIFYTNISEPVFAKSRYGNPVILIGGHRFNLTKGNGPKLRWVCVKQNGAARCKATIITLDNEIVKHNHTHSHD